MISKKNFGSFIKEKRIEKNLTQEVTEMISKNTFGSFIKEKRLEKNLTQKELADILYLSESAVSKWEMGKSYPDITLIPDLCKALDVSEKELISGATDTQYRRMKHEAGLYRKISETFFWGFTAAYSLALVICVIVDLVVNRKISFSLTVFASLLTAFSFVPTFTRFTEKYKLEVFTGSTYFSVVLLIFIAGLNNESAKTPVAAFGILLGYAAVFSPFFIKKYLPEKRKKFNVLIYFTGVFICVVLLIIICSFYSDFELIKALLAAAYSFIPFAVMSVMQIALKNKLFRAAADVISFGVILYFMQRVISNIFGYEPGGDYAFNFSDWRNYTNGNIYLTVLIVCIAAAVFLTAAGLKKLKK